MTLHPRWAPRRFAAALGTACACLSATAAFAACGSDSSTGASSSTSTSKEASEKPVELAMQLFLTGQPFGAELEAGAKAAAKEAGATITVSAPASFDPSTAMSQLNQAIAQGADGAVVAPEPAPLWGRGLTDAARKTDGNVVTITVPPPKGSTVTTYVGNDREALGEELAATTIEAGGLGPDTTGDVLIGNCNPQSETLAASVKGMTRAVERLLPEAKVVSPFNSHNVPSQNQTAWSQQINAHPKTVLGLGACGDDPLSMMKIKQTTGREFAVGGTDPDPTTLAAIGDGTVDAAVAENWYVEGYSAARMLIESVRSGSPPPAGWVQSGWTIVTKANVKQLEGRNESPAAQAAFYEPVIEKLWSDLPAATKPLAEIQGASGH